MEREKFGSRIGFILISAGCCNRIGKCVAFSLHCGAVWRRCLYPDLSALSGHFGLPIMTMEFAVGRASRKALPTPFGFWACGHKVAPLRLDRHCRNYLLMMFYTTVAGWMFIYFLNAAGDFSARSAQEIAGDFDRLLANPSIQVGFMLLTVALGIGICSLGLNKGWSGLPNL